METISGGTDGVTRTVEEQLEHYRAKSHRNEDCPDPRLVDELNRVKWLLTDEERAKVNEVLDRVRWQ